MASPTGLGTTNVTLGVANTIRLDISDYLAPNLVLANNFASAMRVGPEFADTICRWNEDRLNANTVTDTTAGGQSTTSTQLILSISDASLLSIGTQLVDVSATAGGLGGGEMVYVQAVNTQNGVVMIARAFYGTTATIHAQGAIWQIIGQPTAEFTDLGPDLTRARVPKWNYFERQELNVSLSAEVIERSLAGYTPGIRDELEYQLANRVQELLRRWNTTAIYGRGYTGQGGTVGQTAADYSSLWGVRSFLDGTANAVINPGETTVTLNYAAQGWPVGAIDLALNAANLLVNRNGAVPDQAWFGFNPAQAASRLYNDRIRITQTENERGFSADLMHTPLGNELLFGLDGYIVDTPSIAEVFVIDSLRLRWRPFKNQWFYGFTAPTLRDGDSFRALSKASIEFRNTGNASGQASIAILAGSY
jgi:hypothetical protein